MDKFSSKIKNSIKLYPLFYALSADLIFFVPIDTLFLTLVKGLNASEISAITMIGLLVCILTQKIVVRAIKKIGNAKSIRAGALMLFISTIILTFGNSIFWLALYKIINQFAFMFWNMTSILLRNDLIYLDKDNDYYIVRNKAKVMYGISTMLTALISGYLFNINNYLPMYISIILLFVVFLLSFKFYEVPLSAKSKNKFEEKDVPEKNTFIGKNFYISAIFLVILSNAMFYTIIQLGQNNSKLFMQYDFQKVLSTEMVTYYITIIVLLSRIARIIGNIIFGKLYPKLKDKTSIVLSILECMSFSLLIIGHSIEFSFLVKVLMMSLGFFIILAIRDSFQIYIEDVALTITKPEEQQKIMVDIEVYRKIGQLILSIAFTLILLKYELIIIEFVLLILSFAEIIISKKLYTKLKSSNL